MFKLKGQFLGQSPLATKSGKGYIRKFLCSANNEVYTVYADNQSVLSVEGQTEISVRIQDMVFA